MAKITYFQGSKYRWQLPDNEVKTINEISATHNLSRPIAQTLFSRDLKDPQAIRSFLFSSYEKDVADPALMLGAETAVARILKAIKNKEKILIFGDYDVDGITSTSLLLVALLPLDANINFYLPNRRKDGYGLSSKVVNRAASNGYSLIITVDNGISAHAAANEAKKHGVDLIITDHHRPHDTLPHALSIVNPNQDGCPYPHKDLAGVGVTFKLMNLLYQHKNMNLPEKVYELLLLGTVADVVPLITENRYWVQLGLSKINAQQSYAMSVLANNSNITKARLNSLDIGFSIAPQLNALGRLDDPRSAVKFMISSNKNDVETVGRVLKTINEERRRVDRAIYQEIELAISQKQIDLEHENIIMAANNSWPAGVIGLVAGKLMHNYGKPSILFHLDTKNGIAKGSCRSIPDFNMFDALNENKDLLISFGGHSLAAGLALDQKNVAELKKRLEEKIGKELTKDQLQPKIKLDAHLNLHEMNKQLIDDLERLEPFGNKNSEPTFMIEKVHLQKAPTLLKDAHIKCSVFSEGIIKPVIFFNRPDLYEKLKSLNDEPFHIAGNVLKNEWNGTTKIEIRGLDVAI